MKKDKRQLDMTQGNPAKLLVTFAIPMMLGAIFDLLYNMVDAIILGRYVSADALAAVGATTAITGMIVMIGFAFTQSISILIAQAFGAGDNAKLHHLVAQAFDLSLAVSVLLGAASIALAEPLAILLGVPENICGDSVLYIRIVCGMGIARMFYNTSAAVLRAIGDSRTPLYFLIISSVLNILLDIVFVVVFGMEIAGVAWATVIAQLLSAALCCAYMWKKYAMLRGMGIVGPTLASSAAELISKVGFSLILSELFGYVGAWLASPLGWVVGLTISVGYYHFGNWKQRVLSLEEK